MHVLVFNGQWRIGSDSAKFRAVGHSLAIGEGYTIVGEPQKQIYPGLPLMLAGLERLAGPSVWPAIMVMLLMSAATLWLTYKLMCRVVPEWAATVITAGVAFNETFVTHGHELLTDIPFLLGVMMALWGWETLTDPGLQNRLRSAAWLGTGLALAAMMRPTFWVLALAFVLVCAGGMVMRLAPNLFPRAWLRGPDRPRTWRFYAACLALVTLVGLLFAIFDPRTRSLQLLAGAYEAEIAQRISNPMQRLREAPTALWTILEDHLEAAFFAERVEGLNLLLSFLLLVGLAIVTRRRPLWGLTAVILMGALYFASSTPRYFLMVMPILWLGYLLLSCQIAMRIFRSQRWRSIYVGLAVITVINCNLGHVVKLIMEQRSEPFLESYQDGKYVPVLAMARLIGEVTEPHERIIAPHAPEMTYLSQRRVLGRREIRAGEKLSIRAQADVVRDCEAEWAVFPAGLYKEEDRVLYQLGRKGIFVPSNADDSTVFEAGVFQGTRWYLTRDWAIDETMIPPEPQAQD